MSTAIDQIFKDKVLGHPAGLFVLFFTEMWERFSFYGMRALLVLFLVSALGIGGWDWPRENALALYGTYLALLYLTPIIGGTLADKYLGELAVIEAEKNNVQKIKALRWKVPMVIDIHSKYYYSGWFHCLPSH